MRELRWIAEQANSSSSIVQVEMEHRNARYPRTARELIEGGLLGRVYHVRVVNPLPPPVAVSMMAPDVPVDEDDDDDDDCDDDGDKEAEEGSGGECRAAAADAPAPAGVDWDAWLGPATYVDYDPWRHHDWRNFWAHGGGPLMSHGLALVDLAGIALGEPARPRWVTSIGVSPFDCGGGSRRPTEWAPQAQTALIQFDGWYMTIDSGMGIGHTERLKEDASRAPDQPFWATHPHVEINGTEASMWIAPQGGGFVAFRSKREVLAEVGGSATRWWHQSDFIESVRERSAPASSIDAIRSSALLVHWVNIAYRLGAAQLSFDPLRARFTNCEEANKLLQVAYRAPYDHWSATMSPAMAGTGASPA
jgi:predicted dehydrogenase